MRDQLIPFAFPFLYIYEEIHSNDLSKKTFKDSVNYFAEDVTKTTSVQISLTDLSDFQ